MFDPEILDIDKIDTFEKAIGKI